MGSSLCERGMLIISRARRLERQPAFNRRCWRWVDFNTGHLLFVERPQEWLTIATAFLDEVGA